MEEVKVESVTQVTQEEKKEPANSNSQETKPVESHEEESAKDINWKKFKEARALERKQAEEVARRAAEKEAEANALKAAMEAILNKQTTNSIDSGRNSVFDEETEEQRIERKVNELIEKRETERRQREYENERKTFPDRLKNTFKDFDQVCNTSNLDYLEYHHPELAKSLGSREDGFDKWADIYSAIKRYIPNTETRKEQAKAENNFKKPQSLSSPGVTQGGNAMPAAKLDEARKAANWERMQRMMKGLS